MAVEEQGWRAYFEQGVLSESAAEAAKIDSGYGKSSCCAFAEKKVLKRKIGSSTAGMVRIWSARISHSTGSPESLCDLPCALETLPA